MKKNVLSQEKVSENSELAVPAYRLVTNNAKYDTVLGGLVWFFSTQFDIVALYFSRKHGSSHIATRRDLYTTIKSLKNRSSGKGSNSHILLSLQRLQ